MENTDSYTSKRLIELRENRKRRKRAKARRRVSAVLATALVCTASFGTIYTASAKEVTITEINEFAGLQNSVTVKTRKSDVIDLLNENGITVSDTDKLNVPADSEITSDGEIVVRRGKAIKVVTDNSEQTVVVTSTDTQQALKEAGYTTSEADEINLNGGSIAASDTVEIKSVTVAEETETEEIDYETTYEESDSLYVGDEEVITEGENGELSRIYLVSRYENGDEKDRSLVKEEITKEPVNEVIAVGTKEKPTKTESTASECSDSSANSSGSSSSSSSSDSSSASQAARSSESSSESTATESTSSSSSSSSNTIAGHTYSKVIEMTGTAYTDSPSENGGYTITAMGTPLRRGVVAVDPSVIPLGTKVYVVSTDGSYVYGTAVAEDTGGAIKGNRIDLCIPSASETDAFGRRSVLVYVLDD